MKQKWILAGILLTLLPGLVHAQGTVNDLEQDFGARIGLTVDKKLAKGLHLNLEGEARISDNFQNFGRYQAGLGVTYKINPTFKVGAGYLFIEKKTNTTQEWKPRHRVYVDGMATLRAGDWLFSLKERLQFTHRDVNNPYQNNPNSLSLKSRLKVAYKGNPILTPYAYLEARNVFNDPRCSATWSTSSSSYSDYEFLGYGDAYFNRLRGSVGLEWKLSNQHAFDFYVLTDYCYDKNIDTNAEGTKLKSLTFDRAFNVSLGIGYKFSF